MLRGLVRLTAWPRPTRKAPIQATAKVVSLENGVKAHSTIGRDGPAAAHAQYL